MNRAGTVHRGLRDPRRAQRFPDTARASFPLTPASSDCGGSRDATATTRKGDHRV